MTTAAFDVPFELRLSHQPRHAVRPRRDFRRWLASLGRQIGEAFADTFRPVEWLPEDW